MRLRAELDDQTAKKLKDMQQNYKDTFDKLKKEQRAAAKEAREHAKHQKELHERLMKVKEGISEAVIPALGALGIATFSVGEGVEKFIDTMREAGESFNKINDAAKRAGTSAGYVTALGIAFENLGLSPDRARQSVGELGEHLDKLTRGAPDEINRMNGAFSNMGTSLNEALKGAHGREDQMERLFSFMSKQNFSMDQKRKWMATLGIPVELASKSAQEIKEAFEKGFDFERKHPTNMKVLGELDSAFTHLQVSLQGIQADMVNAFGPGTAKMIETMASDFEKYDEWFSKSFGPAASSALKTMGKDFEGYADKVMQDAERVKHAWDFITKHGSSEKLDDKLTKPNAYGMGGAAEKMFGGGPVGAQPVSFRNDDGSAHNRISTAVRDGVLDAFREYIGGKSGGGGGGGFTNASYGDGFGGGGGGGSSSGLRSGGGFRVLPNGGADMPGAPPEGSNAFKGVGGVDPGAGAVGGNAYLAARRARFAKEMQDPNVRAKVKAMMQTEGTPLQSLESAMNRADYSHKTLAQILSPSFYGPMRNRGHFASVQAAMRNGGGKKFDRMIDQAVGGSDTAQGYTDQGMPTDPNGSRRNPLTARDHISVRERGGLNEFTDWEAGPGGRRGAHAYRMMIEQGVREADARALLHGTKASLRDHIRHKNLLGQRSSLDGKLTGDAHVRIDMSGAPRGTRTSAAASGMFKSVKLNRGRAMPMADGDA